jgi:hypothetical protein
MKPGKLRSAIGTAFWFLGLIGVVAIVAILIYHYRFFSDAFTLHSEAARADLPAPYNLPLIESTRIDLSAKKGYGVEFWRCAVLPEEQAFIQHRDSPVELRVAMARYLKSYGGGLWRGESAKVTTSGALEGAFTGDPGQEEKEWGSSIKEDLEDVTPYFDVVLPIDQVDMARAIEDRVVEVEARISVTYPGGAKGSSGAIGFKNRKETIRHRFSLVPLSAEEIEAYKAVRRDYRSSKCPLVCLQGLGISLLAGAVLIGAPFLIARKLRITINDIG